MRDEPNGRDLLETAREALVAEILPLLSGKARYTGAMIANALRMVLADGPDEDAERQALQRLLGDSGENSEAAAATRALTTRLSAAIREGRFDPGRAGHTEMRAVLLSMTLDRLACANPAALKAERASGAIPDGFKPWET